MISVETSALFAWEGSETLPRIQSFENCWRCQGLKESDAAHAVTVSFWVYYDSYDIVWCIIYYTSHVSSVTYA